MAKICTNERSAARQRWIERGLLELMQERKFEEITVTDLCSHLDLPRRSFYRYFTDLADVLDALLHHTFQDMVMVNASLTLETLEQDYGFWYRQKPLLNALSVSGMYGKIVEYSMRYADLEALKKYLRPEDTTEELSREINLFVVSGLSSLLISWHAEGFQRTPEQMARIAYRMLCRSLLIGL